LPLLPIPLLYPDYDVVLDLNSIIATVYTTSGYAWRIDYAQPVPPPKLRESMAVWLKANVWQVESKSLDLADKSKDLDSIKI